MQTDVQPDLSFLDTGLVLAREVVALRERLNTARRQHSALVGEREQAAYEGRDVFPEIRRLFLEIEELPTRTAQTQERANWAVMRGVEAMNVELSRRSGMEYRQLCNLMREAIARLQEIWAPVQTELAKNTAAAVEPSLLMCNAKLLQIEKMLGSGPFPKVSYATQTPPTIDVDLLKRDGILAALERWHFILR